MILVPVRLYLEPKYPQEILSATTNLVDLQITPTPTAAVYETKLLLTGDVMLGRKVMIESINQKNFNFPFLKVADKLRSANITFVNLENPVIEDCPESETGFVFCTSKDMAEGLAYAGVDVVNLANNHSDNYGKDGLSETVKILNSIGVDSVGLKNLVEKDKNGIKFGFLGFDFVVDEPTEKDYKLVSDSAKKVDVLLVAVHWGVEYKDKANTNQRKWAKKLVESGADIVVGHHPHWVEDVECFSVDNTGPDVLAQATISAQLFKSGEVCPLDTKPVFYSLGNFIFDQMWSEETKKGSMVELTFKGGTLQGMREFNTYIKNWGQVEIVDGE